MSQGPFPQELAWKVLNALLVAQLAGVGVSDVQAISEKDFNSEGDIVMTPPSVRTFYAGTGFHSTTDSQRLSYEAVGRFMLLCADESHTVDPVDQAYASVKLVDQVCAIVAGTRINLPTGDISEPITLVAVDPMPVEGVGTAYAIAIEVPGLAQFAGANAAGFTASPQVTA
jgi:hypothetical protein